MNVALWQHRWREYLSVRGYAQRTVDTYGAELKPFLGFLDSNGIAELSSVTRETLEAYRLHLFGLEGRTRRPLTLKTQAVRLGAVLSFFRFLYRERFLVVDPGREMELPRVPAALPPAVLTEAEVVRLVEAPPADTPAGLRDRAILEVLYSSGLRNSELSALTVDELDLERSQLRIVSGKGGKHRVVPLGEPAREAVEAYLRAGRPWLAKLPGQARVFVSARGRALTREALAVIVARAAVAAGLTQRVTPHLLRHACACHMLAHRASLRHIQELLGHASLNTTQRYTRLELSDLRKVHRRCHPRERRR